MDKENDVSKTEKEVPTVDIDKLSILDDETKLQEAFDYKKQELLTKESRAQFVETDEGKIKERQVIL